MTAVQAVQRVRAGEDFAAVAIELRRRELEKQTQAWLEQLRKKAHIELRQPRA